MSGPSSSFSHEDEESQLDALIDLEAEMFDEQQRLAEEEEAVQKTTAAAEEDDDEEGGGFFRESEDDTAAASSAHTAAAASSAAAPAAADPDSIEEDAPARPFPSGCRECGIIGVQQSFLTAFGVPVCFRCQQVHKNRYALCTQTTCTTQYLLPLASVQKLGFISKKNPHKNAWGEMKLYWKQQVLALVRAEYGTRERLEAAKRERDLKRIKRDDDKRRNAHSVAARSAAFASTLATSMAELGSQSPAEVVAMLQSRTRGMAPTNLKDRRSKKRASESTRQAKTEGGEDDDDVEVIDRPAGGAAASRKKKSSSTEPKRAKTLHTHTFRTLDDGRQRCADASCGFTMEFETL